MADTASKFDPKEIADVAQNTLRKFTSLDTPQDMSPAETVADIAAGFVPGIGTAQSARDFERARREGDKLGMGLSAVGMIPVVGGVVKPARKAVDPLAEMLRKYLDKAPSTPSRAAEMRSVQEALARTESRAADAASARQADILSSPETYKEVDWPQRFYRGIRQATRGPNGEMLPEVSSLIMPQRGSEVLSVQPNNPRRTAWAASNPLTASSFASDPNSLVVPLRLREKPDVVFNAEGLPWQRFFSQTGDLSRGSYNYPLRSEFKDMLRDPSVRSILVKDIFDDAANTPEGLRRLSELYGVQLRPENLLSDNLLIKDPSVVEYLLTKETPKMTESLKSKSSPKSSSKKEPTVKEQKMLQGFYRGYAGDYDAARAAAQDSGVFVSPQRAVGEYYANKRAAQTGAEPHLEMILADPFAGRGYGHSTMGTGKNPPMITRARELAPEDVKNRTKLYAEGGAVADTNPNALVTQAYRDILQRDPEQEGLQYWTNQLSTNQLTPESLYQNIAASAQSADAPNAQRYANALQNRNLVTQAYQDILQRAPEQEGLSYWTGQLNTGALTPETLRQNILASAQGADASKAQQYAQNFAATQPQPTETVDPDSYRNPYGPRRTLDDLASMYSIGMYFIPGMQLAAPIDFALRALSLANTAKKIGKIFRFAEGGAVADTDVKSWLAANPGATDYDIAAAMKKYDVAPEQVSRVTGVGMPQVQARYAVARPKTDEEVKQFLTSQPGMTDPQIANAMRMYNVAPEQVSRAINMGLPEVKLRYAFASPPPPPQPQPASGGGNNGTRKALDDLASMYSIGTYFIPGMQFAAPIDYALRGLSLANTVKSIGRRLGFAAGGPVNYDPTEIDTIVSRVKEELHG